MKVKIHDNVVVISGKDRGKKGDVLAANPSLNKVLVRGINLVKHHDRRTGDRPSGIMAREALIHVSNVMVLCPSCGKATRVGFKLVTTGEKARVCKKCREVIADRRGD